MSRKQQSPQRQWEQALLDAYFDHRWREILTPLAEKFRGWEAGEYSHEDMDEAIHTTHKKCQEVYSIFTQKRDWLVTIIQMDRDWFEPWIAANPPAAEVELLSRDST